jgi:hypothetical protein
VIQYDGIVHTEYPCRVIMACRFSSLQSISDTQGKSIGAHQTVLGTGYREPLNMNDYE